MQLHGFCDAMEVAYSGVVYLRATDFEGAVHMALVMARTKLAPIKQLSIPCLVLCCTVTIARLLHHVANMLKIPSSNIFTWTDSHVTLGWLQGNPRRFLAFIDTQVEYISEAVLVACWHHVRGTDNPAGCASGGMFPIELMEHALWWKGPQWLRETENNWNVKVTFDEHPVPSEEHDAQ